MNNPVYTVALVFLYLLDVAKLAFYRNVIVALTGNAAFPTPPVTLPDFTTQVDLVEEKLHKETVAKAALAQAQWELREEVEKADLMARSLAAYVQSASQNNPATIESSGFEMNPQRTPVGQLPAPGNLRAYPGQEGTCVLKWDRVRGGLSWVAECATAVNGPYTVFYTGTRSTCVAENLTPGTQYWFRVRVIGSAGPSDWSNPTTKRAA